MQLKDILSKELDELAKLICEDIRKSHTPMPPQKALTKEDRELDLTMGHEKEFIQDHESWQRRRREGSE